MAENNQLSDETKNDSTGTSSADVSSATIGNHENAIVPHKISNHNRLVQTMVMVDGEWINVNDTNDQENLKKDVHTVNQKVVEAQKGIVEAKNTADSAVKLADSAISTSKVNSDAIKAQDTAISEAKSAIDSANAEIQRTASNAKSDAAQIRADVAQIQKEIDTSQSANSASVEKLRSDISSTQKNLDTVRDNLTKAQSAVEQNKKLINDNVTDINGKIAQDRANIETVQEQLTSTQSSVSDVRKDLDSNVADINSKIAQNQKDVAQDHKDLTTVQGQLTSVQSSITDTQKALNSSVTDINGKITQDRKDIVATQQANADTAKKLDGYAQQAVEQGKTIKTIQEKQDGFDTTIADVEGNVSQVQDSVTGLTASLKDAQGNIASVKAQADQLNTTLTDHSKNIAQLNATAKSLSSTLEDASGRLSKVEQTTTEQSATLSDLQGNLTKVKQTADGLVTTVKDVQGNITQIKQDAKGTLEQISDIQGNITTLQTDVSGIKSTIADHDKNIHTLQADSKTLKDNMADAQGNISSLQKTSTSLTSMVQDHGGRLSKVEQTADGTKQTVADQQGQINTIKTDAKGIHETLTGQGNQIATINTTLDGLNTKYEGVSGDLDKLSGTVTTNSTQIDQNKQAITLKADQSAVDNLSGRVNQNATQLSIQADQINSKVSSTEYQTLKDKINGMKIGGRNYILNSAKKVFVPAGKNGLDLFWEVSREAFNNNPDKNGKNKTHFSFDMQASSALPTARTWTIYWRADPWTSFGTITYPANTTDVQHYELKITTPVTQPIADQIFIRFMKEDTGNPSYTVTNSLLTIGDMFEDYSPNPDDIVASVQKNTTAIDQNKNSIALKADQTTVNSLSGKVDEKTAQLKLQADSLSATVTDQGNNISNLQTTAKETSSTLSTVQGNLSQVKQTADGLVTTLRDAQGNISQLQQTAKGTTEQISGIQGDVTTLQTDVTGVKATIAGHDKNIHTLQADSKTLKDDMADAKGNISSLQKTATSLTSEMQDHSGRLSKVEQTAGTLTSEFSNHDGRLSKVEQTADGTKQTVADQQGQINTIKADATGIHQTLTGQGNQIATINTTLDGLNTKYEDVKQSGNKLKDRLDNLKIGTSNLLHHSDTFEGWNKGSSASVTTDKYLGGRIATLGGAGVKNGQLITDLDGPYDNQPVTWTVYAKADNAGDKLHTELWGGGGSTDQPLTTEWQVYKFTGFRNVNHPDFYLWGCTGNKGNIYVALPFAVVGNTIGTWSPNPADVADKITTNSTQIDQNKQAITLKADQSSIDNLSGKVSQNTAQLGIQADQISSKVSSTDFNTLGSKVDGAITQIGKNTTAIEQNKNQISLKADQTEVDSVKNTATNNSSRLDVMDNKIQTKVTSTDVNSIIDSKGYATTNSVQSMITQSAGSINETITNLTNKVNSNNGGGINLLSATDFSGTDLNRLKNVWGSKFTLRDGRAMEVDARTLNSGCADAVQIVKVEPDTDYTLSFEVYYASVASGGSWNSIQTFLWEFQDAATGKTTAKYADNVRIVVNTNKRKDNTQTIHTQPDCHFIKVIFRANPKTQFSFTRPKLERGSVATPWSPAPSDNATVTQIQQITASIDGVKSSVANKADTSQVTQLSNLVQSKVSSNDFNSKVTQLANDINLRVQKGDLLSQINVEAGRTLIQSNKIYFDADSFVLSPNSKAFIPSAYITEINADKITTGTLDVSKLNVENFTADNIVGGTLDGLKFKTELMNDNRISIMGDRIAWTSNTGFGEQLNSWIDNSTLETDWLSLRDLRLQAVNGVGINTKDTDDITRWSLDWYDQYDQPGLMISNIHKFIPEESKYDETASADQSNAVLLASKDTYLAVRRGTGILAHLDSKLFTNTSVFAVQKDNKIGFYVGGGDNGNTVNVTTAGDGNRINFKTDGFNVDGEVNVINDHGFTAKNVHVTGWLGVDGSKNSIVKTSQGTVAINAYETAEYYFGDIGEAQTGSNGVAYVGIEKLFNETVNTDIPYQVFITAYGPGNVWVEQREHDRFIVKSDQPNIKFGWEIKAKRKGYEYNRLQNVDNKLNHMETTSEGR